MFMKYESRHASHVFHFSYGHLYLTSFLSSIRWFRIENLVIWRTITSLALWIIWKARRNVVLIMLTYMSAPCLLNFGCYLSIHYVVNMMICKVQLMFYGNVKWPLRNNGKGFTYFRIQLLVWGGIIPYLLLCCIAHSYCSTCFIYDILCLIRCLY